MQTEEEGQGQDSISREPVNIQSVIWANAISAQGEPGAFLPSYAFDDPESDFARDVVFRPPHVPGSRLVGQLVHVELHEYVQGYCEGLVEEWRYMVEPMWSIEVVVRCPDEMGETEAHVWWSEEHWYACIEIGCQYLEEKLKRLVVHELRELRRWRSTGCVMEVLGLLVDGADKDRLVRGFHVARNQEVEMECYELLGRRRPFHSRENHE